MIDEIIKLREEGLSFRKIASELNTTIGKVQYQWKKWTEKQEKVVRKGKLIKKANQSESDLEQKAEDFSPLKGELQAKLVSPGRILLYWEVSEVPQKLLNVYFNQQFDDLVQLVRIYDVTDILFNGDNAHHYYEIAIPYRNGYWFIKGLAANRSYIAEIGVKWNNNDFFPLLRSNSVQTPSVSLSNGSGIYYHLAQFQQVENRNPKWIDHVSTYSYYDESKLLEQKNE